MSRLPPAARRLGREFLPPALRRTLRGAFGWQWFRGEYATWAEARDRADGYDQPAILEKVKAAILQVRAGRAAYERDSVLFAEPRADYPLLAALLSVAAACSGRLNLIDFGGSLGTTYWQHRTFLPELAQLRWDVVEQPHFVAAGRREIEGGPLRFFATIDEAERAQRHNLLLSAGTVQYLEQPGQFLDELCGRNFEYLLFNNLPLQRSGPDVVRVQHVPPEIYAASYPVWFFNRGAFLRRLEPAYALVQEFASEEVWPLRWRDFPSTGLLLKRKNA